LNKDLPAISESKKSAARVSEAKKPAAEIFVVQKIIDKRRKRNKVEYLVV